tara:strand:+ start:447 stop:1211 length:765 start_codon:yes stop_codon:yes gene_type:complete
MTRNLPTYEDLEQMPPFVHVPMILDLCLSRVYQWKGNELSGGNETFLDDPNYDPMIIMKELHACKGLAPSNNKDPAKRLLHIIKTVMIDGGCIIYRDDYVQELKAMVSKSLGVDKTNKIEKEAFCWFLTDKGKKCIKEVLDLENSMNVYSHAQRDSAGNPAVLPAEIIKSFNKQKKNKKDIEKLKGKMHIKMQVENPMMTAFCICMEAELVNNGYYSWSNPTGSGYTGLALTQKGKDDAFKVMSKMYSKNKLKR